MESGGGSGGGWRTWATFMITKGSWFLDWWYWWCCRLLVPIRTRATAMEDSPGPTSRGEKGDEFTARKGDDSIRWDRIE